jgi:glucosamine--fructose-6-phosphate aminotransferase (isomerizing)
MMNAGPEICVLSTKSYTSQLAILLLLAYTVAGRYAAGKQLITEGSKYIDKLIDDNIDALKALAAVLKDRHDIFAIGRNSVYATALEAALKIKEVSYIHAEGFAGAELKHGTIALIEQDVPVIVFATGSMRHLMLSNAMEVKSRGAFVIGIDAEPNEIYSHHITMPFSSDMDAIFMIIPIQILAYYLAVLKNLDPDKPRNLAKSVTVK